MSPYWFSSRMLRQIAHLLPWVRGCNELWFYVDTASPWTSLSKFCLLYLCLNREILEFTQIYSKAPHIKEQVNFNFRLHVVFKESPGLSSISSCTFRMHEACIINVIHPREKICLAHWKVEIKIGNNPIWQYMHKICCSSCIKKLPCLSVC
jgi:hypothetical protein